MTSGIVLFIFMFDLFKEKLSFILLEEKLRRPRTFLELLHHTLPHVERGEIGKAHKYLRIRNKPSHHPRVATSHTHAFLLSKGQD